MASRKSLINQLPQLPFANNRAIRFDDAATLSGRLTGNSATKIEYWPTKAGEDFQFSFSSVASENLRVVSSASTSLNFSSSNSPYGIVLLPFHGASVATRNRKSIAWGNGRTGIYLPPGTTSGNSELRVVAGIDVEPDKLNKMAYVMLGQEVQDRPLLDLETFRVLELVFGEINFLTTFQHYMALLDAMGADGERMERMGLADMILRSTVMLLAPHLFFNLEKMPALPTTASQAVVAKLCDYIEANLTTRITLTELERLSGLSARNLQYSFRSLTGMSPMQWITERRLEAVRRDILNAKPGVSLSTIASLYFSNLGDFARYYRKRYGELPSETLFHAQRQPFRT